MDFCLSMIISYIGLKTKKQTKSLKLRKQKSIMKTKIYYCKEKNCNNQICKYTALKGQGRCTKCSLLKSAKIRMKNRRKYNGKNNPNYKYGQKIEKGYIYIYSPNHPRANKNYVKRANLVMEKHLGRYLKPEEVIHHKDGNRLNDKFFNLELLNKRQHLIYESSLNRRCQKTGRFLPKKGYIMKKCCRLWKKYGEKICLNCGEVLEDEQNKSKKS